MPTAASDAVADRPSVEQEMAKFKGFASTDGEVSAGAPKDEENEILVARQAQRDQSKAAQQAEDDARASEAAKSEKAAAAKAIELSTDEEDAAVEAAESEKGEPLTDEEREKAVADALAKKQADAAAKPAKSKRSVQERINNYRRAAGAAERHAAAAEGEAAELRRRLAAYEKGEVKSAADTQAAKKTEGEPDPAKFEFGELDPKYIRALARYEAKQEAEAAKAAITNDRKQAEEQQNLAALRAKTDAVVEKGIAEYEDFEELVIDGAKQGAWALSQSMLQLMSESEVGHKVAYHLASNPKEAARIFGLSPLGQAAAFGRLEARFSSESSDAAAAEQDKANPKVDPAKVAKTTKAPNPVKPARGAGGSNQVGGDTKDFAAFEALVRGGDRRK